MLPWATGTWSDRGGAYKDGEWWTEEGRKCGADGHDSLVGSGGGGATVWPHEGPSWVNACAVCGSSPEEGNMGPSTPGLVYNDDG